MKHFFLFLREPEPSWTSGKRLLFWFWQLLCVVFSALGVGYMSLRMAVGPYEPELAQGYYETPLLLILNLAPVVALALLFYALFRSAHRSFLLTALITLGFSAGNYFKLYFRDDPLMLADLFLLKEAGNMTGNYSLFLSGILKGAILVVVLGYLFLRLFVRGRPPKRTRTRQVLTLTALTLLLLLVHPILDEELYNGKAANYAHLESQWAATQQYIAHGFVYPFLHSAVEAVDLPPPGYERDKAMALLEQYEDTDIPEEQKVNFIGIMLEAYNDFTRLGIQGIDPEVYQVWHDLEAEGVSGDLITNIFAGGTVDTERCFLTGFSKVKNFRENTNAYPWYFRSQGYTVEGMHPCYQWFYNRSHINRYLGFENYYFVENYFGEYTEGKVAYDYLFFQHLLYTYRTRVAQGAPYFTFSVTYQGHGPYSGDSFDWAERGSFYTNDGSLDESQEAILHNYLGSIASTNQQLKMLTDALREDPEPVVLVLFGDHNPWMGDGNAVFEALGVDFNMDTKEGFTNYYGTRYLIWANEAAKKALGKEFQGEGPTISPGFLMNEVFRQCGWTGPAYLQATNAVMDKVSVVNVPTGLYVEDGQLTGTLSPEGEALIRDYQALQYYSRGHFRRESGE